MTPNEFILYVLKKTKKHGVTCIFAHDTGVQYADEILKSNGYWSDEDKTLAVAIGKPVKRWIKTLAHEYCHFTQFVEGGWDYEDTDLWRMCDGKKYNKGKMREALFLAQECEQDCEKRVIKLARRLQLPINLKAYAKHANAYVYFYAAVEKYGKWYTVGNEPYNNKNILREMPNKIDDNYRDISEEMIDFIAEECGITKGKK